MNGASLERKVFMSRARFGPALAWTNDHLVYVLDELPPNQNDSNVWSVKIDPHTGKPLGTATRLTAGPGRVQYLSSTIDGKQLAYVKQGLQPDLDVSQIETNATKLQAPRLPTLH